MQDTSNNSLYNNWSIEQGDYERKGLSKDGSYYKQKISLRSKILIILLSVLAIALGIVLITSNKTHI
ncbi:MAG: hypothetical protein Q8933_03165 [Bacteroidota bacterium]|nr:hypothetical protein [Bacteroidota bacterium]MDP4191817.1 hypothetical protein [Bacteroidota bacterium]MDP4193621.1 hypothetical protein [Bacteroidota bacterium]